jgi:thiol-disulfide isomerase/thioredoxin/archaellum component FlaF (FlaF/FlaG flagellin family)
MKKIILFLTVVSISFIYVSCFSQKKEETDKNDKVRIDLEIKGWGNKDVVFGSHYMQKNIFLDTVKTDNNGKASFEFDSTLATGTYFIVFPKKTFVEVIIDDNNRNFKISADINDFMNTVKVEGSKENELFVEYQKLSYSNRNKMRSFSERMQKNRGNQDSLKVINKEIEEFNVYLNQKRDEYIQKAKGTFFADMLKALKDIIVPDTFSANPNQPTQKQQLDIRYKKYMYYKHHFFDYIDFSDPRFIHTTVFANKLNKYFTQVAYNDQDSITHDALEILKKAEKNKQTLTALAKLMINNFENSGRWANEKAFIAIAENYFLNDKVPTSESFKQKLQFRVNIMKKLLVGEKAPSIPLAEMNTNKIFNFEDIKAPLTILYFWSADCHHCQKFTPGFYDLYKKYKDKGLKVIAVTATNDFDNWKKYVADNGYTDWINAYYAGKNYGELIMIYDIYMTPRLYILDKDKKIIAKDLDLKTLKWFLHERLDK